MPDTPVSLLERLRDTPTDEDWQNWSDLYRPVLERWLEHAAVRGNDADEVIQRVFVVVWTEMKTFERERVGSFRKWLRGVVRHRMLEVSREARRAGPDWTRVLEELADSNSGLSKLWDQEHDQLVLERLLRLVEGQFSPEHCQAFRRLLAGDPVQAIAESLGMTVNAVYVCKSKILRKLREEADGLVD